MLSTPGTRTSSCSCRFGSVTVTPLMNGCCAWTTPPSRCTTRTTGPSKPDSVRTITRVVPTSRRPSRNWRGRSTRPERIATRCDLRTRGRSQREQRGNDDQKHHRRLGSTSMAHRMSQVVLGSVGPKHVWVPWSHAGHSAPRPSFVQRPGQRISGAKRCAGACDFEVSISEVCEPRSARDGRQAPRSETPSVTEAASNAPDLVDSMERMRRVPPQSRRRRGSEAMPAIPGAQAPGPRDARDWKDRWVGTLSGRRSGESNVRRARRPARSARAPTRGTTVR